MNEVSSDVDYSVLHPGLQPHRATPRKLLAVGNGRRGLDDSRLHTEYATGTSARCSLGQSSSGADAGSSTASSRAATTRREAADPHRDHWTSQALAQGASGPGACISTASSRAATARHEAADHHRDHWTSQTLAQGVSGPGDGISTASSHAATTWRELDARRRDRRQGRPDGGIARVRAFVSERSGKDQMDER